MFKLWNKGKMTADFCLYIFDTSHQIICVSVVLYEIFIGTSKFLSEPVATRSFTTESDLPTLTICSRFYDLRIANLYGLDYGDYEEGKYVPDNFTMDKTLDEIFQESVNEAFFLLDVTGT